MLPVEGRPTSRLQRPDHLGAGRVSNVSSDHVDRGVPPARPMDTSAAAEEMLLSRYRKMSPAEKIARVVDLNRTVETLASARLRARYGPDLGREELKIRLAALRLDRRTMVEVFAWDPETRGL